MAAAAIAWWETAAATAAKAGAGAHCLMPFAWAALYILVASSDERASGFSARMCLPAQNDTADRVTVQAMQKAGPAVGPRRGLERAAAGAPSAMQAMQISKCESFGVATITASTSGSLTTSM